MSRTDELLEQILVEMQRMRQQICEIQQVMPPYRATYDADDMHSEIGAVKEAIGDMAERITGPLGYSLGDLHNLSTDMVHQLTLLEINTAP